MKLAGFATAVLAAAFATQAGTFALLGGTPKVTAKFWATERMGAVYVLDVQQFTKSGAPIKAYDIDMEHLMHMVVVRDDFATFAHKHPSYDSETGTFETPFAKQPNHRYYVYADTTPTGFGQQVFRFTMESDGPQAPIKLPSAASSPTATAGPYTVTIAKTTLGANTEQEVNVSVKKDGKPATDLVPYLGAPAHVVLLNVKTLAYVHAHPMLQSDMKAQHADSMSGKAGSKKAGPFMMLHLGAMPAGVYAAWVQISGGKDLKVYAAPFTIVVK